MFQPVPSVQTRITSPRLFAATTGCLRAFVEPGAVRLLRVNQVFTVGDTYQPTPTLFSWTGNVPLALDGDWYELRF